MITGKVEEILSEEHADGVHSGEELQYDVIGCPECSNYISRIIDEMKEIRQGLR